MAFKKSAPGRGPHRLSQALAHFLITPATVNLASRICSRGPMSVHFRRFTPVRLNNDSRCFDRLRPIFWQDQSRAPKAPRRGLSPRAKMACQLIGAWSRPLQAEPGVTPFPDAYLSKSERTAHIREVGGASPPASTNHPN